VGDEEARELDGSFKKILLSPCSTRRGSFVVSNAAFSHIMTCSIAKTPFKWVLYLLRVLNIGNAVLLGVSAFFSWFITDGSVTRIFLTIYQMLFGLLVLLFELRVGPVARWIKRQFGFMFTFFGRLVFLVLISAVTFGMLHPRPPSIVGEKAAADWEYSYSWVLGVGIATVVNAVINAFVLCSHPHFKTDPQGKITDEEIKKYLAAHPEAVAKAPGGGAAAGDGYTPPVTAPAAGAAPMASYAPPPAPAASSKFYGSADADAGLDVGDIDPFSEPGGSTYTPPVARAPAPTPARAPARAPAPAPVPAPAPADTNPFADDENPFA
jgi:hypothetical protein